MSIARSLRFQSGLPIKLWGECILAATYIINRLPSPILDHKTPFECLYDKTPDYFVLKVFGCLCYVSIHDNNKFSPRAIKHVFLGYPLDHKGYKLFNLETKQIFISRHVVFDETIFPYLIDTHTSTSCYSFFVQNWVHDDTNVVPDLPYPNNVVHSSVLHSDTTISFSPSAIDQSIFSTSDIPITPSVSTPDTSDHPSDRSDDDCVTYNC